MPELTEAQVEALMWAGITPPAPGRARSTCPQCSDSRRKATRKCLRIFAGELGIEVHCHHCGWEDVIV